MWTFACTCRNFTAVTTVSKSFFHVKTREGSYVLLNWEGGMYSELQFPFSNKRMLAFCSLTRKKNILKELRIDRYGLNRLYLHI